MRRRDVSLTVAMIVSLVAHGMVVGWGIHVYTRGQMAELLRMGRWTYTSAAAAESVRMQPSALLAPLNAENETAEVSPKDEIVEPEVKPPPAPPSAVTPPPPARPNIGDDIGGGEGAARTAGEAPQRARQADQTQASLSTSPEGAASSGGGGAGAAAGTAGTPGGPPSPKQAETAPDAGSAAVPARQDTPLDAEKARESDGFLKEGGEPSSPPPLGVRPDPVQTPKIATAPRPTVPPPPTAEEKEKALPDAREEEERRESTGRAPDAKESKEPAAPSDGKSEATDKPTVPELPTAEKEEARETTGQTELPAGGTKREEGNSVGTPAGRSGAPLERTPAQLPRSAADRTSPLGDEKSAADRAKDGLPKVKSEENSEPATRPVEDKSEDAEVARRPPTPRTENAPGREETAAESAEESAEEANAETALKSRDELAAAAATAPRESPGAQTPTAPQLAQPTPPGNGGGGGAGGDGRPPGVPAPPGENATQSDSESDPFSKVGSVSFSRGKVEARFGRKVKWVRPRLTLSGQIDASVSARSSLTLGVTINNTGRVTKVDVLDSSGFSDTIDLPVVRAVYSWWIEPLKNRKGEPIGDTMVWRIELR